MKSILEACQPRPEILEGRFNPEVFTASLGPVAQYYRTGKSPLDSIYTDAEMFFRDATYPTQGMRTVVSDVFRRIAGDPSAPAIHRLETAFGGGKTHALIACTHLAHRGTELSDVAKPLIDPQFLPQPGSVSVIAIMGDEIPVHKPQANVLVPYTLWGEIAYQIGGEVLYDQLKDEVTSFAAPGASFLTRVLAGRKVLIMLDELAQYAARLNAAHSQGSEQLAAFLMGLHTYARSRTGVSVVLTLAGRFDAFSKQTQRLAKLLADVQGKDASAISEDEALQMGEQALIDVSSVVARDAVPLVPVQASEIASVLGKRLFVAIDKTAAEAVADEYADMYRKNISSLPEGATAQNSRERMVATYPFHPTLLDYLSNKLSEVENFQGTRGVLRVLSLAVKSIWEKQLSLPMIHVCHIDLRNDRVSAEILGRTGNSELQNVVNADVGGVDTGNLESGRSNAQALDYANPHPKGFPMHEYAWRTVLLNSLVGQNEGLSSRVFGVSEQDALYQTSFPGLTPSQLRDALKQIEDYAFYLKRDQGKYYASMAPTINNILSRIRKTISRDEIEQILRSSAQKVVSGAQGTFEIEHDVSRPEDIPDRVGRPIIALVSLNAGVMDIDEMITTKGPNKPREYQNLVILLVPETVVTKVGGGQAALFRSEEGTARSSMDRLEATARFVAAMRKLEKAPQAYGVAASRLGEDSYKRRSAERNNALLTEVSAAYTRFYHPSTTGHIMCRDVRTVTGEGGKAFLEQIREDLADDVELLGSKSTKQSDLTNLSRLFFPSKDVDTVQVDEIWKRFLSWRDWPMLEAPEVCEQLIRVGVQKGVWYAFRMDNSGSTVPSELYHRDKEVPMGVSLTDNGYWLLTPEGAKKRGWVNAPKVDKVKVKTTIADALRQSGAANVTSVQQHVKDIYGELPDSDFREALSSLLRDEQLMAYTGTLKQIDKPTLISGVGAAMYLPHPNDVIIMRSEASRRGWLIQPASGLHLSGKDGAARLMPLLRQIGTFYKRGAKTNIGSLDLAEMELKTGGGRIRVQLTDVQAESVKNLDEFFEVLDRLVRLGPNTEAYLDIAEPDQGCPFVQALTKKGETR